MLNLIRILKQQFIECNSVECYSVECNFIEYNSAKHINGNKTTKYQKQDILFLERFDQSQRFLSKITKARQKVINRHSIYYTGYVTKNPDTVLIV